MAKYQSYNDGQQYFEVINLEKELPADNRARIIKEIVCGMDLSDFDKNYKNDYHGANAKNVRMMVGIILLGIMKSIPGSRTMESQMHTDIEFKYILEGNKPPDDSTIRLFRRRHIRELSKILSLTIHMGSSLGMLDFGALAIDGTKIKAYASLYETKNKKGLTKSIRILSRRMERVLKRIDSSDTIEEREEFKKRLKNINKRESIIQEFQELLEDKAEDEKLNRVDPDAKLMKGSDGKSIIGYNAQVGVDCGKYEFIVSSDVVQDAVDDHLLEKIRDKAEEETGKEYEITLADSGYINYETMEKAEEEGKDILGPDKLYESDSYGKSKKGDYAKSKFQYHEGDDYYICPEGHILTLYQKMSSDSSSLIYAYKNEKVCSQCNKKHVCISKNGKSRKIHRDYREPLREKMRKKLDSNEGYLLYGKRSQTVEPVFGHIKQNRGQRQFYYRGLEKVRTEWSLICSAINLNKIIKFLEGKNWLYLINYALKTY